MTYEQLLQKAPPTTAAGNKRAAKEYVTMIQAYLNAESASLSHSQKNYLYRLRGRWELRAQGRGSPVIVPARNPYLQHQHVSEPVALDIAPEVAELHELHEIPPIVAQGQQKASVFQGNHNAGYRTQREHGSTLSLWKSTLSKGESSTHVTANRHVRLAGGGGIRPPRRLSVPSGHSTHQEV